MKRHLITLILCIGCIYAAYGQQEQRSVAQLRNLIRTLHPNLRTQWQYDLHGRRLTTEEQQRVLSTVIEATNLAQFRARPLSYRYLVFYDPAKAPRSRDDNTLYIPLNAEPLRMMRHFSANPINEPRLIEERNRLNAHFDRLITQQNQSLEELWEPTHNYACQNFTRTPRTYAPDSNCPSEFMDYLVTLSRHFEYDPPYCQKGGPGQREVQSLVLKREGKTYELRFEANKLGIDRADYLFSVRERIPGQFNSNQIATRVFNDDCFPRRLSASEYDDSNHEMRIRNIEFEEDTSETLHPNKPVEPLATIFRSSAENYMSLPSQGEDNIIVGVIDTGVDYNNPAIAENILRVFKDVEVAIGIEEHEETACVEEGIVGYDFLDNDSMPYDFRYDTNAKIMNRFSHGTPVAAIIAEDNPQAAIIPIRMGFSFREAAQYAIENGARVINISMSTDKDFYLKGFEDLIRNNPNVLFICSAGNAGISIDKNPEYPASWTHPNLMTIGAVDEQGNQEGYSNYGQTVDIMARTHKRPIADAEGVERPFGGTSMATPVTTNVVVKMLAANPSLTPAEIKQILISTGTRSAALAEACSSSAIVNEETALKAARERITPITQSSIESTVEESQ